MVDNVLNNDLHHGGEVLVLAIEADHDRLVVQVRPSDFQLLVRRALTAQKRGALATVLDHALADLQHRGAESLFDDVKHHLLARLAVLGPHAQPDVVFFIYLDQVRDYIK